MELGRVDEGLEARQKESAEMHPILFRKFLQQLIEYLKFLESDNAFLAIYDESGVAVTSKFLLASNRI
jgi:hypothetical protein